MRINEAVHGRHKSQLAKVLPLVRWLVTGLKFQCGSMRSSEGFIAIRHKGQLPNVHADLLQDILGWAAEGAILSSSVQGQMGLPAALMHSTGGLLVLPVHSTNGGYSVPPMLSTGGGHPVLPVHSISGGHPVPLVHFSVGGHPVPLVYSTCSSHPEVPMHWW